MITTALVIAVVILTLVLGGRWLDNHLSRSTGAVDPWGE